MLTAFCVCLCCRLCANLLNFPRCVPFSPCEHRCSDTRFARLGILSCTLRFGVTAFLVSTFAQTIFHVRLDTSTQLHICPSAAEPSTDGRTDRHVGLPACVPVGTAAPQGHAPVIFSHFIKLMCRRKLKEGSEHGSSNDARLAAVTSFSKNIFPLAEMLYF